MKSIPESSSLYRELSRRFMMMFAGLVLYRLGSYITIPGIQVSLLKSNFDASGQGIFGLFNMFTGGGLSRLSLFSLGLMPYITSSIIMQLLTISIPYLQELNQEGPAGRRKISQYTRYATILLALLESMGLVRMAFVQGLVMIHPTLFIFTSLVTLATGTMLALWIGEQMTEKGLGNGISMLIFAGIAARIPETSAEFLMQVREGAISPVLGLLSIFMVMGMVCFVVFFERSTRQIPIQHARHHQINMHQRFAQQSSILPLKLNLAGVMPPIFATSLIFFPHNLMNLIAGYPEVVRYVQPIIMLIYPGKFLYYLAYTVLIFCFTFFYIGMTFHPNEISDNLKRSGGVIPGIRPGIQTQNYIQSIVDRLSGIGALYLCFITLFPDLIRVFFHLPFSFGGTTLLIVVVVMMEMIAQVQAHLIPLKYRQMMKNAGTAWSLLK